MGSSAYLNPCRAQPTNEDAGEVWQPAPSDTPYYDQMDYDYMDAEDGGPTTTAPRKKEEGVKKEVKEKKEDKDYADDYEGQYTSDGEYGEYFET